MDRARQSKLTRHLLNREKTFYLVNSGDKLMRVPWGRETIVVPGAKHITPPHRKFSDVRHSVILNLPGEGETLVPTLIPGTLVVKDIIQIGDVEDRYVKWDAAVFIFEKIGQDFDGEYGRRSLLGPAGRPLEELQALAIEGRERWEEASIKDAQMVMYEQQVKESKWMQHNMAPPPPPTYVLDAKALLEEAARRRKKAFEEMFIQGDPYAKTMVSVTGEETEIQEQSHEGVAFGLSLLPMDEKTAKKRA